MPTRRQLLETGVASAASGIVFCGCGLLHGARAQQPVRQTLPVMVGGKRVKTIDVHAHCQFREAGALLASAVAVKTSGGAGRRTSGRRCDGRGLYRD